MSLNIQEETFPIHMNFTPPYLSTIKARTLIAHDDRDEHFPVSIPVEMYQAIPHSYLWIVPNSSHGPWRETFASGIGREMSLHTTLAFLRGEWEA
jgi:pimeloyl-ACP methyl ester carboxylesterase